MKTTAGRKTAGIIGYILSIIFSVAMMQTDVQAAGTVAVTADKSSVAIGENVNITVQTSTPEDPATAPEVSVTYNSDILSFVSCDVEYGGGGGGLLTFSGESAVITFTAAQTGSVNVAAEAIIDDDGANPAAGAVAVTVGAGGQEGLSSDATLYVLEMNPGEMVPAFSSDVTDYKIIIDHNVTDITVSGAVSDPGAQITAASGFKNLKEGTNQAVITVTAADGTTLTYHFTIERGEGTAAQEETQQEDSQQEETQQESEQTSNGLSVTIDGANYTVQSVLPEELLPAGCVKTTSSYNSHPVEAALFEKGGLTLLYALEEGGESGEFFVYNEGTGKLQFFVQIYNIENRFIVPIEAQDNPPAQFKAEKMQWNNSYLPAFVLADTSVANADAFYLLYAVSNEGERGFYLYDAMEGTYQRFLNYTGAKTVSVSGETEGIGKKAVIVIAVLVILLIGAILLIVNMVIKNKEMQEDELLSGRPRAKKKSSSGGRSRKSGAKRTGARNAGAKRPATKKSEPVKRSEPVKKDTMPEPEELLKELMDNEPAPKPAVRKTITPQQAPQGTSRPDVDSATMETRQVTGAVGITGNIPIKVVPTPKSEVRRPSVPIYTLERPPVQLTREAPPDQLDDDFEFEFINMDNE